MFRAARCPRRWQCSAHRSEEFDHEHERDRQRLVGRNTLVKVRKCCERFLEIQLAGACVRTLEVGFELPRLTTAAARKSDARPGPQTPVTQARLRPGWVYELVFAVLAAAFGRCGPQEVVQLAERLHGHSHRTVIDSELLCAGRLIALAAVERHGYGRYGLRR